MKGLKLFLLLLIFVSWGCSKIDEVIPNVSFSGQIYLPGLSENPVIVRYDQSYNRLGINGIVIYRLNQDEYYAFDLMCPYEKSLDCMVRITDGATCKCPCCDTQYIIVTNPAGIISGPSKWPLKSYRTVVSGDYLYVSN
jgi:hypothetical protein